MLPIPPKYHHQPTIFAIILCSLLKGVSIPNHHHGKVVVSLAMRPMHVAPSKSAHPPHPPRHSKKLVASSSQGGENMFKK